MHGNTLYLTEASLCLLLQSRYTSHSSESLPILLPTAACTVRGLACAGHLCAHTRLLASTRIHGYTPLSMCTLHPCSNTQTMCTHVCGPMAIHSSSRLYLPVSAAFHAHSASVLVAFTFIMPGAHFSDPLLSRWVTLMTLLENTAFQSQLFVCDHMTQRE